MALAWNAGWVNSPQEFESPILRSRNEPGAYVSVGLVSFPQVTALNPVGVHSADTCAWDGYARSAGTLLAATVEHTHPVHGRSDTMAAFRATNRPHPHRPRPARPLQPSRRLALAASTIALALMASLVAFAPAHASPQRGVDPVHTPTRAAGDFSLLIAYSFGNRIAPGVDPTRTVGEPGPVNEALAETAIRTRGNRAIPIYAQTEIARVLHAKFHAAGVVEIPPNRKPDGTLVYLSTDGVAAKVAQLRGPSARVDVAGIIAFSDHLWRAVYTTRANGLDAYAPAGIAMPSTYDGLSGQDWTRSRAAYLPRDYAARLALLPRLLR